jgi:hypothetical protein
MINKLQLSYKSEPFVDWATSMLRASDLLIMSVPICAVKSRLYDPTLLEEWEGIVIELSPELEYDTVQSPGRSVVSSVCVTAPQLTAELVAS